ncbi:MAG: transposase [Planctomycetota bacterium]
MTPIPNRARQEAASSPNRDRKGAAHRSGTPVPQGGTGPLAHARRSDRARTRQPNRARQEAASARHRDRQGAAPFYCTDRPLAYLITFPTYGTWLHGDERGSVDRDHNIPGTPLLDPAPARQRCEVERLQYAPVVLDTPRRHVVHQAIVDVAQHPGWTLHALNVRTNHVHVVVSADQTPERVMNAFKSWATRRMVEAGVLPAGQKAWARHGSTGYLWKPDQVEAACAYVVEGQGADLPMDCGGPRSSDDAARGAAP